MSQRIQSIRGMNDILPQQMPLWHFLEDTVRKVFLRYGYEELRPPILEKTELFSRSIGEVTDIVEKEMYTFADRDGDSLSLRPEGTAGCVRAGIENGLFHNQIQRVWYAGPMFRYERPQQGRYRQFYQMGVEAYGLAGPDIDAEVLLLSARFWQDLGLKNLRLVLNSLGGSDARTAHRTALVEYFSAYPGDLDEDSQRRLHTNPLRILDSKNPDMQELIQGAPQMSDYLEPESRAHFEGLRALLDSAGIAYTLDPRLVRGLDYYNHTVFEWQTTELGAQNAVCAGGRYDGLVAQIGGKPTPAVGFAMGLERLVALLEKQGVQVPDTAPHVYVISVGDSAVHYATVLAEQLRTALPDLRVLVHCGGGGFKSQFKRADKSGAQVALIAGEDEVAHNRATLKYLREDKEQETLARDRLAAVLARYL